MERLIDLDALLEKARQAAQNAYAPYSGYRVGAALLCGDGQVFTGSNVENASFSLTICAERSALFQAVNAGQREFLAIAIHVDADILFPPCGACRQVLAEFSPQMLVIYGSRNESVSTDLEALLPQAFSLSET